MRIGFGYDNHHLVPGRALILGGVHVPSTQGPEAHSDGDALIHALIDALLGACALGDIGQLFPPSDEQYRNISAGSFYSGPSGCFQKQGSNPETWTPRSCSKRLDLDRISNRCGALSAQIWAFPRPQSR